MSQAKVTLRSPIVRYVGSITDMHGYWRVESTGERLTLRSAYELTLSRVRHTSVQLVEVPTLTPTRADALRMLARRRGTRIDTRAAKWLVANDLAEVDEETGGYQVSDLGWEVAAALPRWY